MKKELLCTLLIQRKELFLFKRINNYKLLITAFSPTIALEPPPPKNDNILNYK